MYTPLTCDQCCDKKWRWSQQGTVPQNQKIIFQGQHWCTVASSLRHMLWLESWQHLQPAPSSRNHLSERGASSSLSWQWPPSFPGSSPLPAVRNRLIIQRAGGTWGQRYRTIYCLKVKLNNRLGDGFNAECMSSCCSLLPVYMLIKSQIWAPSPSTHPLQSFYNHVSETLEETCQKAELSQKASMCDDKCVVAGFTSNVLICMQASCATMRYAKQILCLNILYLEVLCIRL